MGGLFVLAAADGQLRLRVELRIWELGGGQWGGLWKGARKRAPETSSVCKSFLLPWCLFCNCDKFLRPEFFKLLIIWELEI